MLLYKYSGMGYHAGFNLQKLLLLTFSFVNKPCFFSSNVCCCFGQVDFFFFESAKFY
jgi:hypothetical protein